MGVKQDKMYISVLEASCAVLRLCVVSGFFFGVRGVEFIAETEPR
jgi:hypothetical protein